MTTNITTKNASSFWKVPTLYIACSTAWIMLSDHIVAISNLAPETQYFVQSAKGLAFVAVSAGLAACMGWAYRRSESQARAAIEERDERHRLALGSVQEAAFDFDLRTRLLHWSYGLRQLLGSVESAAVSDMDRFKANIHPEDRQTVLDAFEQAKTSKGNSFNHEFRMRTKSGNYLWMEVSAMLMKNLDGIPTRMVGVLRDITDRKSFEMRLLAAGRSVTALSEATSLIATEKDIGILCEKLCRLLVNRAGYKAAWISRLDQHQTLQLISACGLPHSYFALEPNRLHTLQIHESPITVAASKQKVMALGVSDDMTSFTQWRERAAYHGFSGCIAIPLTLQSAQDGSKRLYGMLTIFLGSGETFGGKEQLILEALGRDISFALSAQINAKEIEEVRAATLQAELRMNRVLAQTIAALSALGTRNTGNTQDYDGHENRAVKLSLALGAKVGLSDEALRGLEVATLLHDIGCIAIPQEIITKPSRLTDDEQSKMREHPMLGHEMIADIEFPWPVKDVVLQHHERMDGSGYPFGLKGPEICMEARIMAVVDVVEAMASPRPYRPAHSTPAILATLREYGKFDPQVVAAFEEILNEEQVPLGLSA